MEEQWAEYESPDLTLRYPGPGALLLRCAGCRLMLVAPDGSSEFRSSLTFTDEPASDEIREVEVKSRPAKLVRGIYREGRLTVGLDQWMTQTSDRLWSISASYDRDSDAGFFELANEAIATLRLDEIAPR